MAATTRRHGTPRSQAKCARERLLNHTASLVVTSDDRRKFDGAPERRLISVGQSVMVIAVRRGALVLLAGAFALTPASPLSAHSRPVKSWLSWNAARKTASLLLVAGYNGVRVASWQLN